MSFRLIDSLKFIFLFYLVLSNSYARWETLPKSKKINKELNIGLAVARNINLYKKNIKNLKILEDLISRNRIKGLELVIAAPTGKSLESRFGHAMVKFVSRNEVAPGNDFILSLVADINTPRLSYLKGIFGGYAVYPTIEKYRDVHNNYIKHQNRKLDRYAIHSDLKMRQNLFKALKTYIYSYHKEIQNQFSLSLTGIASYVYKNYSEENIEPIYDINSKSLIGYAVSDDQRIIYLKVARLKKYRGKKSRYTFFGRNCAGAIVDLFKKAKIKFSGSWSMLKRIPTKLPKYFYKNGLILLKKEVTPGLEFLLKKISKITGIQLHKKQRKINLDQKEIVLNNLDKYSFNELFLLYDLFEWSEQHLDILVQKILSFNKRAPKYDKFYQLGRMYWEKYKYCLDQTCAFRLTDRGHKKYGTLVNLYKIRKHPWSEKIKEMISNLIVYSW
jgi:hypothetical protein